MNITGLVNFIDMHSFIKCVNKDNKLEFIIPNTDNKRSLAAELGVLTDLQVMPFFIGFSICKSKKLLSVYDGNPKNVRMQLTDEEYEYIKIAFL